MLYFHGEPFGEVVKIVNRYAEDRVCSTIRALQRRRLFAAMRVGDTAAIETITER